MLKKVLAILLMCFVTNVAVFAEVKVKLKDGKKLKVYISEIKADSFVVVNEKTGAANEVPYSQPKQVKGKNLSNGAKIAIGIGLIVGLRVILIIAGRS